MRAWSVYAVLIIISVGTRGESSEADVKKLLQSDNYTSNWGSVPTFRADGELEIGAGNGHGGTLRWLRFRPEPDGVQVLAIKFHDGLTPYRSKWPPDKGVVKVEEAWMKPDLYAALLRDLAVVESAKLKPVERDQKFSSSNDFWVYVRLREGEKIVVDRNWAGYEGSREEVEFAKPRAMVQLALVTVQSLEFKDHALAADDRAWASSKFARDWRACQGREFHWWVRERYLQTIGFVGDESVLPVLRELLAAKPREKKDRTASDDRCVYHAINAVCRLTGTDVRERPVEQMDIEKTRRKVLELINDKSR